MTTPAYENEIFTWPAQREFDTWRDAFDWAFYQRKAEGPKYKVQSLRNGQWEAIQAWMCS